MPEVQFELNITDTCPAKCHDCIMSLYKSPDQKMILEVIREAQKYQNLFIWATGGEPLLKPGFVEEVVKLGSKTTIATMGIYNEDAIVKFMDTYQNINKVNVSVPGTPEFEKVFRKIDGRYEREWIWKVNKHKINIIFVVFKDELESGKIYENIDYVFEKYGDFQICVLYDRCDRFNQEKLQQFVVYLKEQSTKKTIKVSILPYRILRPTVFVSDQKLGFYHGRSLTSVSCEDSLKDMEGFLQSVISGHELNSMDSKVKCDVYQKYPGCGGPACRYGYVPECRDYWSQFIKPLQMLNQLEVV